MSQLNRRKTACAVCVLCATMAMGAIGLRAQTFTSLFSFDYTDGANPDGALTQGTDGNLYGTTTAGANRGGTVFAMTPSGTLTTLYSFCSQSGCTDGSSPYAGLVQTSNGNFYGTTVLGGAIPQNGGYGTVFTITPSGALTTLYSFCSQTGCTDGENPYAGLVQATNGNFYGTTEYGGPNTCVYQGGRFSCGTIFEITASGTLTRLHSFDGTDGFQPFGALIQATNGNLYGTTYRGGKNNNGGTAFKITPSGTLTTLHKFCSESRCMDGANPYGGLVQGTNGNFYGTTAEGGANSSGTVFKVTPSGTLTTLQSFDPGQPYAGLVQATDGNFYGTTYEGGAETHGNGGMIFKISPSGTITTLYSFCSQTACTDGSGPHAGLVQATDGNFYGTTKFGGADGDGTVFSLSVGLDPFVETQPASGAVGAAVNILGTILTGATSVTFNGTATSFTVVSPSLITTTVPAGATSGTVQVVTPAGTLSSNVPFRVIQ